MYSALVQAQIISVGEAKGQGFIGWSTVVDQQICTA